MFFLDFSQMFRESIGVKKQIPDHYKKLFVSSYHAIALKYGPTMARWMPEIIFGGSVFLITYDTMKEVRIIKAAEKKERAEKQAKETPGDELGEAEVLQADMPLPTDTAQAVNQ